MYAKYGLTINGNPYNFNSLKFDHEGRMPDKSPTFTLELPNVYGSYTSNEDFTPGKVVEIIRENESVFRGVIEPRKFKLSSNASIVTIQGVNLYYKRLNNIICDSYDFKETTQDYGVTINPWEFKVLRFTHPSVELMFTGETKQAFERPILDGYRIDDVVRHVVGIKFLYSHDFEDASHILPSRIIASEDSTPGAGVYRSNNSEGAYYQTTPRLQLMPDGFTTLLGNFEIDTFTTSAHRDFYPLNGGVSGGFLQKVTQRFRVPYETELSSLAFKAYKVGTPGNLIVNIASSPDNYGTPNYTFTPGSVGTSSSSPTTLYTPVNLILFPNTDYFIIVRHLNGNSSNRYYVATNTGNAYPEGEFRTQLLSPINNDLEIQLNGTTVREVQKYRPSGTIESVSLMNGDPNIEPMGLISEATITLYGKPNDGSIVVSLCRNGGKSHDEAGGIIFDRGNRDYTTVTLIETEVDVPGTTDTITKWTGTLDSNDWDDAPGRELAYKIRLVSNDTNTACPEIEYVKLEAIIESDTSIEEGIIEEYFGDASIDGSEFFEGNVESITRLKALNELRNATIKIYDEDNPGESLDASLSTFWDLWIDVSGEINFKRTRGSTIDYNYSFENDSLTDVEYEYDGSDIWYTAVGYGAGSGVYRTRLVSNEEFDDGGLRIQAVLDEFGDAAKQGSFEDSGSVSVSQLYRKTRAALKLHSQPFESLILPSGLIPEVTRRYDVGDLLKFTITDLDIVERYFPIEDLSRTVNKDGEKISLIVGTPRKTLSNALVNISDKQDEIHIVRQPTSGHGAFSGNGVYFDKNNYGVYTFGISEPEKIDRVALKIVTVPVTSVLSGVEGSAETESETEDFEFEPIIITGGAHGHEVTDSPTVYVNGNIGSVVSVTLNPTTWTSFSSFTLTSDEVSRGKFAIVNVFGWNDSGTDHPWRGRVKIIQSGETTKYIPQENGRTAAVSSTGINTDSVTTSVLQFSDNLSDLGLNTSKNATFTFELYSTASGQFTDDFIGKIDVYGGSSSGTSTSEDEHEHVLVLPPHSHPIIFNEENLRLQFGIITFDGDNGTNDNNAPLYAANVQVWIDTEAVPTVNDFESKVPMSFGVNGHSVEIDEIDVTPYLKKDGNGFIKRGIHRVWVKSSDGTSNNDSGLGCVQIVELVDYKD